MKTKIFLLLLISMTYNCFSFNWFSKSQQPLQPKVMVVEIYDPINFKACSEKLYRAKKESNIVGVLLLVNSGGGSSGDFAVIHDMVKKLSSEKPVICVIMGKAFSGGYLIASAASFIFAHTFSEIGSIGVWTCVDRYSNAHIKDEKIKADLKAEILRVGEFKALWNPYSPELTESQRAFIQAKLIKSYDTFIALVAQNRNLQKSDYKTWAEGKDFEASQALELGLIDGIGTIFHAEDMIKGLIVERDPHFGSPDDIEFVY